MNEVRLIDANSVDVSQTVKGISDFAERIKTTLDNAPTVDAIEIPKNATNGDMIKNMFNIPDSEIEEGLLSTIYIYTIKGDSQDFLKKQITFNKDWWNAPYKRGREE